MYACGEGGGVMVAWTIHSYPRLLVMTVVGCRDSSLATHWHQIHKMFLNEYLGLQKGHSVVTMLKSG